MGCLPIFYQKIKFLISLCNFILNLETTLKFFQCSFTGLQCTVTYQVIDTECGCVKLSSNRLKFENILKSHIESGVLIVAESINSVDKILFLLPEYLANAKRRKTIIAITNTTDLRFDSLTIALLTKIWDEIRIANIMLITPCNYDSEVWNALHLLQLCSKFWMT